MNIFSTILTNLKTALNAGIASVEQLALGLTSEQAQALSDAVAAGEAIISAGGTAGAALTAAWTKLTADEGLILSESALSIMNILQAIFGSIAAPIPAAVPAPAPTPAP